MSCVLLKLLAYELKKIVFILPIFEKSAPFDRDMFAETLVRRLAVSPRLARVCDLRLLSFYVSHTASSRCAARHLTLQVWEQLHLCVFSKYSGTLGFNNVYYCRHIKNISLLQSDQEQAYLVHSIEYQTLFLTATYLDLIRTEVHVDFHV